MSKLLGRLETETPIGVTDFKAHVAILEEIASTLDAEEVLKRIVETAVGLSRADEGSLLLIDEYTEELYLRANKDFEANHAKTFRQKVSHDYVAGQVVMTGRPILVAKEQNNQQTSKVKTGYLAHSILNIPIQQGQKIYGVLGVYNNRTDRDFTQADLLRLSPLANYAAIAIKNANRYQELQQLLGDAYALTEISELFTETRDFNSLLSLIGTQTLNRLSPADRVIIHIFNPYTKRLEEQVRLPLPNSNPISNKTGFASGEGVAGQVHEKNRLINVPDVQTNPAFVKRSIYAGSLLVAPISKGETCIGTISVASPIQNAFGSREERLLNPLSTLANVAIENARLFENEQKRATQLWVVAELAEKLTSILHLDELLQQAVTLIHKEFGFDDVVIKLIDPKRNQLIFHVAAGVHATQFPPQHVQSLKEGLAGWSATMGRTALANDVTKDERYVSPWFHGTQSELDIPLKYRTQVIGILGVQSQITNAFKSNDILALEALADQIAVAIENARLYQQSQERLEAVEKRNRELNSLREILGALQSTLSLPELLTHIARGVVEGLNYTVVVLAIVDEFGQELTIQKIELEQSEWLDETEKFIGQPLLGATIPLKPRAKNLGVQVCFSRKPQVTHTMFDLFRPLIKKKQSHQLQALFNLQTFAILPIEAKNQLLGVLYAATQAPTVSRANLDALQAFANQAALAIQNAHVFEHMHQSLRRRFHELQSLQGVDRLISSTPDPQKMLENILSISLKLLGAESGHIFVFHKQQRDLVPKVSYPVQSTGNDTYKQALVKWVAKKRKTARAHDTFQETANGQDSIYVQSELAAPILIGDELVGVINMTRTQANAFTEEDESLLDILATQTAVAIQTSRYYQQMEESHRRSLEAERIAAMSDMASNMVHDINNKVGAIRVLVQQIRLAQTQEKLTPEVLTKKLDGIQVSAEKTLEMARNITTPFRNLNTETIDVNAVITTILNNYHDFPTTVDLQLNLTEKLPPIKFTQQLEDILRNLINNALEAMQRTGHLHITTQHTKEAIEISVTDSGPGLPDHLSPTAIFNLGVTSKRDGLGYGLWWCKICLGRVGGDIYLDETVTTGSKFVIKLPLTINY